MFGFRIIKDKYQDIYLLVSKHGYVDWHGTKKECRDKLNYLKKNVLKRNWKTRG